MCCLRVMHVLPSCDAGLYCRKGGIFYPHAPLTLTSILSYPTYPAPMHFREDGAFYAAPAPQHTLIQGHSLPGGLGGTSLFQSWARARAHTHTCTHTHAHTHAHAHTCTCTCTCTWTVLQTCPLTCTCASSLPGVPPLAPLPGVPSASAPHLPGVPPISLVFRPSLRPCPCLVSRPSVPAPASFAIDHVWI